jgi:hypothetical protein
LKHILPAPRASTSIGRLLRGAALLVLSLGYLSYVFRATDPVVRHYGLGDWQDPYFINALLEHWYSSAAYLANPSSPWMYYPVPHTLGYSHGLVLFALVYVPLRVIFHPFHAHTLTLLVVMEAGALCLYAVARRLGLSYMESLAATAFFLTSRNVVHGETGVWSQRASVFLIPPLLLLLAASVSMPRGARRLMTAAAAGAMVGLLYLQDFYTAHFAVLCASSFAVPFACVDLDAASRALRYWRSETRGARLAILSIAAVSAWAFFVLMTGGAEVHIGTIRVRSHDWTRPALLALVAAAAFGVANRRVRARIRDCRGARWIAAVLGGAGVGAGVFLWIYLGSYLQHRAFPAQDLLDAMMVRHPGSWTTPLAALRDLDGYPSLRSFVLVFVVGAATLVWPPGGSRRLRVYAACALVFALIVLLLPFRFPSWSVWTAVIRPLPGFGVIRDPRRIIQVFELAVAMALILYLRALPPASGRRLAVTALALVLMVLRPNPERFDYERRIDAYERWVAAPIAVDPSCRSFFVSEAPGDYASRSRHLWSLYGVDALFIAERLGIPTLNGYSAWFPEGWALHEPPDPEYNPRVARWIARNRLEGVCRLDLVGRTMSPWAGR